MYSYIVQFYQKTQYTPYQLWTPQPLKCKFIITSDSLIENSVELFQDGVIEHFPLKMFYYYKEKNKTSEKISDWGKTQINISMSKNDARSNRYSLN